MNTRAEVVEEGAKVIIELCWLLLYLCIKPETSEMSVIIKAQFFRVSSGNFWQPDHYWSVLKIDILGPALCTHSGMYTCMHHQSLTPCISTHHLLQVKNEECARFETRLGTTIDITTYLYTTRNHAIKIKCMFI